MIIQQAHVITEELYTVLIEEVLNLKPFNAMFYFIVVFM